MQPNRALKSAKYLADDPVGVERETTPRKIQQRPDRENLFMAFLSADWLRQLNSANHGEPAYHSLSLGIDPIIVTEPAIIIQPVGAMDRD